MSRLDKLIGQKLAGGGVVVGVTPRGTVVVFRVLIDGEVEEHEVSA